MLNFSFIRKNLVLLLLIVNIHLLAQDFTGKINPSTVLSDQADLYTEKQEAILIKFIGSFEKFTSVKVRITTYDTISEDKEIWTDVKRQVFGKWFSNAEDQKKAISIIVTRKNKSPFISFGEYTKKIFTQQESKYIGAMTFYMYNKTQEYFKGTNYGLARMYKLVKEYQSISDKDLRDSVSSLQIDHVFILVENSAEAIKQLEQKGFVLAKDAHTIHKGQGTEGDYFYFQNFYIELLTLNNIEDANNNINNVGVDYAKRIKWKTSNTCPFGIGLAQLPFDSIKIPYPTVKYRQEWMNGPSSIQMSLSNTREQEPIQFVLSPSLRNKSKFTDTDYEHLFDNNPEKAQDFRHINDAKRLTHLTIYTPLQVEDYSEALRTLRKFSNVEIVPGKKHLMVLEFDNNAQRKTIDLEQELSVQIKL